jgi:hypothetical protein
VLKGTGLPTKYIVEKSDSNGATIWLADFLEEELELVTE